MVFVVHVVVKLDWLVERVREVSLDVLMLEVRDVVPEVCVEDVKLVERVCVELLELFVLEA